MAGVAIVTDTTHYLPRELADANDLHQVSLYVNWGAPGPRVRAPDFDAYYEHLRVADQLPTTSQPSVGDFLAVFEPAAGKRPRHPVDPPLGRPVGHV